MTMMNIEKHKLDKMVNDYLRRAWTMAKNQAVFRKQEWLVPWEYYRDLWLEDDRWARKGNKHDDLVFCRKNDKQPWDTGNVQILSRGESLRKNIKEK